MPNFSKPFTIEVDACGQGLGAVLTQEGRPLAYISKAISPKNLGLSTYEKEFLAGSVKMEALPQHTALYYKNGS